MTRVITDLASLQEVTGSLHIALGVFDGVHIGHRAVIKSAVSSAEEDNGVSAVLTFDPHPIRVLAPHVAPKRILASLNHKKELLSVLGVDLMIVVSFTQKFSEREAIDFLNEIKDNSHDLKTLAIGEDWEFGKQRQGNVVLLRAFGQQHDINIKAHSAVMLDGERVSSTRVRQAVRDGNLDSASAMLGRPYTVLGTVIHGRQLGRQLGFPTANLRVYNEQLPCNGVWVVKVIMENGESHYGVGNLGLRPTVEGSDAKRMLEVYILDFSGDLYGKDMETCFIKYVREEKKFASVQDLKCQIQEDVDIAKKLLSTNGPVIRPFM